MECGSVEKGFAEADLIMEDTFQTQAQSHCSLETHCCIATCSPTDDVKFWVSAQAPHPLRQRLAWALNLGRVNIQRPCQPLTQWMRRLGRNPKFNIIRGAAGRNATVGFKTAVGLGHG